MSQEKPTDQVIGLEELFLSQEFGQTSSGATAPAGPRVPLVPTASEAAGHASTTHRRRNAFAALSGTAAAAAGSAGLDRRSRATDPGRRFGQPIHAVGSRRAASGIRPECGHLSGGLCRLRGQRGAPPRASRGTAVSLADLTTASSAGLRQPQSSDLERGTGLPVGRVAPAGPGPGTGSTAPAPAPAPAPSPSGDPLAPVTSSVGSVIPGASTAVSGLVTTITPGLPAADAAALDRRSGWAGADRPGLGASCPRPS